MQSNLLINQVNIDEHGKHVWLEQVLTMPYRSHDGGKLNGVIVELYEIMNSWIFFNSVNVYGPRRVYIEAYK